MAAHADASCQFPAAPYPSVSVEYAWSFKLITHQIYQNLKNNIGVIVKPQISNTFSNTSLKIFLLHSSIPIVFHIHLYFRYWIILISFVKISCRDAGKWLQH